MSIYNLGEYNNLKGGGWKSLPITGSKEEIQEMACNLNLQGNTSYGLLHQGAMGGVPVYQIEVELDFLLQALEGWDLYYLSVIPTYKYPGLYVPNYNFDYQGTGNSFGVDPKEEGWEERLVDGVMNLLTDPQWPAQFITIKVSNPREGQFPSHNLVDFIIIL